MNSRCDITQIPTKRYLFDRVQQTFFSSSHKFKSKLPIFLCRDTIICLSEFIYSL